MATCDHCGTDSDQPFTCSHCGQSHCPDHRLPENHDCAMHVPERGSGGPSTSEIHGRNVVERAGDVDRPEPMDLDETTSLGTTRSETGNKSPPVRTKNQTEGTTPPEEGTNRGSTDSRDRSRSLWYKIRGTVRAPFALLGRYLIPLLAFALVFLVVLYVVGSL